MQPNPFVDEVGIEAVAQGDVCDGGTGFRTLLNDLGLERFCCRYGAEGMENPLDGPWPSAAVSEGVLAGRILLNYAVWGNGSVSARLWNAIRSDDWAIPHVGLSSLGKASAGRAQTSFRQGTCRRAKGLRALGYNVRIGV